MGSQQGGSNGVISRNPTHRKANKLARTSKDTELIVVRNFRDSDPKPDEGGRERP